MALLVVGYVAMSVAFAVIQLALVLLRPLLLALRRSIGERDARRQRGWYEDQEVRPWTATS